MMTPRTQIAALAVAILGFGAAFAIARSDRDGGRAIAADARPSAFHAPVTVRAGRLALPAGAPELIVPGAPAAVAPRALPAPPPARPAPAPAPAPTPAPAPPPAPAPRRQSTPPPRQTPPPEQPAPNPAPKKKPDTVTIVGGGDEH
jgi:peptidoglycan DL-endopeptidase CwlO